MIYDEMYVCDGSYAHLMHAVGDKVCRGRIQQGETVTVNEQASKSSQAGSVERWWMEVAQREIEQVVPKAIEYGSADLVDIGHTLARTMKRDLTEAEEAELGIYFYLVGKMSRWTDAVKRGDAVSDDTLHDIGVYVRMAQRVRSHGGWPGVEPVLSNGKIDGDPFADLR